MQKCKTVKGLLVASTVAAMFSTFGAYAQTTSAAQSDASAQTSSTGSMAKLSSGDEKALKDMAQANINEVAAAKIALDKAQSSEVKAFAQKMVDDHGSALEKVETVAKQKGVTLPTEPDASHKAMADKLEKESGDAFDKMYMENAGTKDHKRVLSKLQSDAKNIKDPDVKALADAHTPVVEQHLQSVEKMKLSADK